MEIVTVKGEVRKEFGKKATKAIRGAKRIPCVLYGVDSLIHFTTTLKDVKTLIYTPDFKLAEVEVDGQKYRSIIKDIQWHPVTDEIIHIDFLKLIEGHSVKLEVPVRFVGVSPGVKAGGKLQQKVRRVKIKTVPEHMVSELELDISKMELGQSIRVRDIKVNENIEIIQQPGTPVATVEIPRALRSAASAAAKEVK